MQLKQIDSIGVVSARKLNMAGISTIDALEQAEPHRIEMVLGRGAPFGRQVLERVKGFPKIRVGVKIAGKPVMIFSYEHQWLTFVRILTPAKERN
jgi:ATP-dependent DNA helicase HFM1/MER3